MAHGAGAASPFRPFSGGGPHGASAPEAEGLGDPLLPGPGRPYAQGEACGPPLGPQGRPAKPAVRTHPPPLLLRKGSLPGPRAHPAPWGGAGPNSRERGGHGGARGPLPRLCRLGVRVADPVSPRGRGDAFPQAPGGGAPPCPGDPHRSQVRGRKAWPRPLPKSSAFPCGMAWAKAPGSSTSPSPFPPRRWASP